MIHYDTLFHTISHCDTPALLDEGMKEVLVYSRTNTDVHVDQEKVLSWLKWIWREASPA
jgi:hypothetical protein